MLTLHITANTWLKQSPKPSDELPPTGKHFVRAGDTFSLRHHEAIDDLTAIDDNDHHALVNFTSPVAGKHAWYAYQRHVAILDDDILLFPAPEDDTNTANRALTYTATNAYKGKLLSLPGGLSVYTDQPVITGGNFSWGEATHGGARLPRSAETVAAMVRIATELQKLRDQLNKPIRITSWFRPEPFNSRVGGARRSRHLIGDAVDIAVVGMSGREIARAALPWWIGGIGIYRGNRKHICHLDTGPKRTWGI